MKNTQNKAVFICLCILITAILSIYISLSNKIYAVTFISIFIATSSFVITFLFLSRSRCMSSMLDGKDLIVAWIYSEAETLNNINETKDENKGLWVIAMPTFSIVSIIIIITIGVAGEFLAMSALLTLIIVAVNILIFKLYVKYDSKPQNKGQLRNLRPSEYKNRYVYISKTGIYAHGMLHVWKGWGSSLKEILYHSKDNKLSFTYTYLRPYGIGSYTVDISIPGDSNYLDAIKNNFLITFL